ncbi:MAG: hypothetical protein ABUK01_02890 [Leptospirales bacterium]
MDYANYTDYVENFELENIVNLPIMRRMIKRIVFTTFIFSTLFALSDNAFSVTYALHAFEDYGSTRMKKMELIGVVTSKGHEVAAKSRRKVLDYDTREMILSAQLYEHSGVRIGDEVFVIQKDPDHTRYKNGLIVGRGVIVSVFQTEFQGWMLKASGNLSMVKKGHFIARLDFGTQRALAMEYSSKGDRYFSLKDYSKAYYWYKQSLDLDSNRPESYIKLSKLMHVQGMDRKAFVYIKQAWDLNSKIVDPNAYLELPGLYIPAIMQDVERKISGGEIQGEVNSYRLRKYLKMLNEVRKYKKQIVWIKSYLSVPVLRMLEQKGIPHPEFQYQYGALLENIYHILNGNQKVKYSYTTVLEWLSREERAILLTELVLPYRKVPYEDPRKSWDDAYFKTAMYHFELAHELNSLDTRSAYKIVLLAEEKVEARVPQKELEMYVEYIHHYSREYLRVPDEMERVLRIRQIAKRRSQS